LQPQPSRDATGKIAGRYNKCKCLNLPSLVCSLDCRSAGHAKTRASSRRLERVSRKEQELHKTLLPPILPAPRNLTLAGADLPLGSPDYPIREGLILDPIEILSGVRDKITKTSRKENRMPPASICAADADGLQLELYVELRTKIFHELSKCCYFSPAKGSAHIEKLEHHSRRGSRARPRFSQVGCNDQK